MSSHRLNEHITGADADSSFPMPPAPHRVNLRTKQGQEWCDMTDEQIRMEARHLAQRHKLEFQAQMLLSQGAQLQQAQAYTTSRHSRPVHGHHRSHLTVTAGQTTASPVDRTPRNQMTKKGDDEDEVPTIVVVPPQEQDDPMDVDVPDYRRADHGRNEAHARLQREIRSDSQYLHAPRVSLGTSSRYAAYPDHGQAFRRESSKTLKQHSHIRTSNGFGGDNGGAGPSRRI